MQRRPVQARQSEVVQAMCDAPILNELRRISDFMVSQEMMCERITAEVQQVRAEQEQMRAEILQVQSGQAKVCTEMEKKVDALALSEAQFGHRRSRFVHYLPQTCSRCSPKYRMCRPARRKCVQSWKRW
jgi:hypothetical protein